jgi:hypothetical protein
MLNSELMLLLQRLGADRGVPFFRLGRLREDALDPWRNLPGATRNAGCGARCGGPNEPGDRVAYPKTCSLDLNLTCIE